MAGARCGFATVDIIAGCHCLDGTATHSHLRELGIAAAHGCAGRTAEPVAGLCMLAATSRVGMRENKERAMLAFLCLEASQPGRKCYRLALGVFIPPEVASVVILLSRLF